MNSMKFSLAPFDVRVFESRILVIVSYAVALFLFATPFSGASAHAGGQEGPVKDAPVPSDATRPVVEKINAFRRLAGLQPVELDEGLSRACRLHAQYLVANRADPKAQGLGAHTELQELAGYTAEGQKAAKASNISWG